jgi:hypothetical protein
MLGVTVTVQLTSVREAAFFMTYLCRRLAGILC